jgi:choline kinase
MVGGYKSEMLKKEGVRLKLNPEYYKTNMVWTLFSVEEELNGLDGDVIVSYGDIVYSRKILQALLRSTADIAVVIDKEWEAYWRVRNEDPLDDAETLKLGIDGTIREIGRVPQALSEIEGQYIGLMKFSAQGISQIKEIFYTAIKKGKLLEKAVENAYMTDLLQEVINTSKPIVSVPVNGGWVEVDTVEDLNSHITKKRIKDIAAQIQYGQTGKSKT